jgi:hypothetical protein
MSIRNSPSVIEGVQVPCLLPNILIIRRGNKVNRNMITVSSTITRAIGRAIINDHRSEKFAANVLGVISPKVTINTVMMNVAIKTLDSPLPSKVIAIAVPKDDAKIIKAFSVRRIVEKNFSG